mmetsp:Transcript_24922/g.58839  ORF Transcript_24922/g.58839 Transcript_24922/m.58839 type:complete len:108 (+) Transcript_24922:73-396(+)
MKAAGSGTGEQKTFCNEKEPPQTCTFLAQFRSNAIEATAIAASAERKRREKKGTNMKAFRCISSYHLFLSLRATKFVKIENYVIPCYWLEHLPLRSTHVLALTSSSY